MPLPDIPSGIEKKCNDVLAGVQAQLTTYQPVQLTATGKMWQGIKTPDDPVDGNEKAPIKSRKPTDQGKDWSDLTLPATTPCAIEVHVHQTPNGWGYTLFGEIVIAGRIWRRAIGVGAGSTAYDWTDVTPSAVI